MFTVCVSFLLLVGTSDFRGVDGASCTADSSCQATDYTLDTCISGVCLCINSSFTPVRTGCAFEMDTPEIYAEKGHSNQVLNNQSFSLVCYVFDAENFEWYLDGRKLSTVSVRHTATASSSSVGRFTCRGISFDGLVKSNLSEPYTVQMLGGYGGLTTSRVLPIVVVPTKKIVSGETLKLSCINIPNGYTGGINYTVNGVLTNNPVVIVDSSNAGKYVQCTIADGMGYTFLTPTSTPANLPTLTTNIQNASVTYNGKMYTEVGKPSGSWYELKCQLIPDSLYLGESSAVTYEWLNSNRLISGAIGATYNTKEPGIYSCTARLNGQLKIFSNNTIKVDNGDNLLVSSTTRPIKGGRVILTCGRTPGKNLVLYLWMKDNKYIGLQYDQRLQIDNFDSSDDGIYKCFIVSYTVLYESTEIDLQTQTSLGKPRIGDGVCGSRYGERGDYRLECLSDFETIGMTYEWTVNGVPSSETSKYYNMPAITKADNGVYLCRTKFGTLTSPYSDAKYIAVSDPGLICYHDYTCIAAKTGYTGKCDKDMMCKCSYGYTRKGEGCSDAILTATSSTVVIAMVSFVLRIF